MNKYINIAIKCLSKDIVELGKNGFLAIIMFVP